MLTYTQSNRSLCVLVVVAANYTAIISTTNYNETKKMKVNTYTNEVGQLVSDYTEESEGESLRLLLQE